MSALHCTQSEDDDKMYEQPQGLFNSSAPRVFVIGAGVERVHDWRALRPDRAIRAALADAGLLGGAGGTEAGRLIGAAFVDRVLSSATDHLPMPTFCVQNTALNSPKTLLLARQLIRLHGHDCVLALGLDRYPDHEQNQHADSIDIRSLINEFDHVQRRQRFAEHQLWQQIERLETQWLHDAVIVACLLANESFVRRHVPGGWAMEIRDMRLAAVSEEAASRLVRGPRMIETLGFVRDAEGEGVTQTGLAHCAMRSRALRLKQQNTEDDCIDRGASNNEILLASYCRYESEIKAKL